MSYKEGNFMLLKKSKDTIITDMLNKYIEERYQGKQPDIQKYLEKYPKYARELKEEIEGFEWILKVAHYDESVDFIEDTTGFIERIQPELDKIDEERKKQKVFSISAATLILRGIAGTIQESLLRTLNPSIIPVPEFARGPGEKPRKKPEEVTEGKVLTFKEGEFKGSEIAVRSKDKLSVRLRSQTRSVESITVQLVSMDKTDIPGKSGTTDSRGRAVIDLSSVPGGEYEIELREIH